MNIHIDGCPRLALPLTKAPLEEWGQASSRQDRAALASMDVVEELSGGTTDDWQFHCVMEFFGLHVAEVVRARVNSGWQETPLEAAMLERVAKYAEGIAQWRERAADMSTRTALEELAKAAKQAAQAIREEDARGNTAPF